MSGIQHSGHEHTHSHDHNHHHSQDHTHHHHRIGHSHDTGNSSIDYYAVYSGIRHWDPRFKVGFSVLLLLFTLIGNHPVVSVIAAVTAAILTVGFGKLHPHQYISVLTIPLAFIIVGSLAVGIEFAREPLGDWNLFLHFGYMFVTKESLMKMLALMIKVFGAVSAMFIMTLSTPSFELFSVIKRMHCPTMLVELMHMIYRFIFILMNVQRNMRISAESRMGFCDFKTSLYTFGQIASNLFIVSLKKANAFYDAMEARCYDGEFLFLEEETKVSRKLVIAAAVYFTLLLAVTILVRVKF
ncbi:MAG: cobalt ECF transporter T component CbiQ [Lachnospiraceae bacterium]|nr:cobalt ECF transporter T component CbiQ [Lachnospiraceae bacterium]